MTRLVCFMAVALLAATTSVQADSILQLDFGGPGGLGTYVGNNAPAGIAETVWNGVVTNQTNPTGGLVFADGSAATGVTIETGVGGAIDWNAPISQGRSNNALGAGDGTLGIYDTALTGSWFFGTRNENIGVRVSGLAPGDYDVYSINREPTEPGRTYDVGIGVADTTGFTGLAVTSLTGQTANATAFVDGHNFATERVTVTSTDDFITVIVDPTNERFGTISGLQIVAVVPEPSSFAIMLGLGVAGLTRRKRS